MLNPTLSFDDCLDHVKSGDGLEHLDRTPLDRQREAVLAQEEMLRSLVLADSPFIVRGENLGMGGQREFAPDEGDFYLQNWLIAQVGSRGIVNTCNDQFAMVMDGLARVGMGPFIDYLQEWACWDVECQVSSPLYYGRLKGGVWACINELTRNAAVHGNSDVSSLWISSKGLLVSSEQVQRFDIHEEYARRMALPPERDPLGREIERPKYLHAFKGPGAAAHKSFVRGKGLGTLATIPDVQVHTEFLPEDDDNDERTRFFMFSPEPFKK